MRIRKTLILSGVVVAVPIAADVLEVPSEFPTIQGAIDAAVSGDEVVVASGTYNEAIDLLGKSIVVRSESGAEVTVIDGIGLDVSVITCVSGEGPDSRIIGFTVTRGVIGTPVPGQPGFRLGGGLFAKDSSPTIEACRFIGNRAGFGGGAYFLRSDSTVTDCLFHDNMANTDGGGAQFFDGSATVQNCTFTLNRATQSHGGGAHFVNGTPKLFNCVFGNNTATVGGGFSFFTNSGEMLVSGVSVTANIANGTGGGIWITDGASNILLEGAEVCGNFPNPISGDYTDLGKNEFCTGCPGDLNNNGVTDAADISVLLGFWGFTSIGIPVPADLDNSGMVDAGDLTILLANWGKCAP